MISSECITWLAVFLYHVYCYSNSEPSINRSFLKNHSLRTRAMYLVINLTVADMFVGGFSLFSLFVTLLYLCDIVQFPHLKLLNPGTDINNWLALRLVSSDLSYKHLISLDQQQFVPIQPFKHRLIKN